MKIRLALCRDLDTRDVIFDHSFVFERSLDFRALITRYRGTVCRRSATGWVVTAWQKSLYRFGNFPLEEAICATILLSESGIVHSISLDKKSHGGLGPFCDFKTLQICMNRVLRGKDFAAFSRLCPTSGDVRCLHLFEVLGSAAGFYEELLQRGDQQGSEEELLRVHPQRDGIRMENEHIVFGQERRMELMLRHDQVPGFSSKAMPESMLATLTARLDGDEVLSEQLEAGEFRAIYGKLNRSVSKCHRIEKAAFGCKSRMRFTNYTSLTGLLLLTMSHSAMRILRGPRILMMLQVLQSGGERMNCIGFASLSGKRASCVAEMQ